jgi:hypothetical protein
MYRRDRRINSLVGSFGYWYGLAFLLAGNGGEKVTVNKDLDYDGLELGMNDSMSSRKH